MVDKSENDETRKLIDGLNAPDQEHRMAALESLTRIGHLPGVWQALTNENRAVSHTAIGSLIKLKASEHLCHAVKGHDSATVRRASVHALKDIGDIDWIREAVKTDDLVASNMAMCVLANLGDEEATNELAIQICRDDYVSEFVAEAAAHIGCGKLAKFLIEKVEVFVAERNEAKFDVPPIRTLVERLSRILDKDAESAEKQDLERMAEFPDYVRFWRVTFRDGVPESVPISLARRAAKLIANRNT